MHSKNFVYLLEFLAGILIDVHRPTATDHQCVCPAGLWQGFEMASDWGKLSARDRKGRGGLRRETKCSFTS
jgi:hypothetical protein